MVVLPGGQSEGEGVRLVEEGIQCIVVGGGWGGWNRLVVTKVVGRAGESL